MYRAIDFRGATIDFLLSALRDADAAKRLFRKALSDRSHPQPRVINTDLAPIYSSAIPDSKTNAFSKKLDNLKAACALHFAYYNFCRIHQSLRVTPAMEAGIADHAWKIRELLA